MTFYYFAIFISSLTHSILRYFFIVYVWTNNLQWLLIYNVMFYLVGILSLVRSLLKWGLISIFPFFHVFVFVFVFIAYHEFSLCKLCRCFLFSLIWFAIFWRYCFFRLLTRYFFIIFFVNWNSLFYCFLFCLSLFSTNPFKWGLSAHRKSFLV